MSSVLACSGRLRYVKVLVFHFSSSKCFLLLIHSGQTSHVSVARVFFAPPCRNDLLIAFGALVPLIGDRKELTLLKTRQTVCTSLQTDDHTNTSSLKVFTGRMPFLMPDQQCQKASLAVKSPMLSLTEFFAKMHVLSLLLVF